MPATTTARRSTLLGEPAGPITLRIRGTSRDGQIVRLRSAKCTVGSSGDCTLRLRAAGVQPVHCLILRGPRATLVRRWSSDTLLNGLTFCDAPLVPGDRLRCGPIELEMLGESEARQTAAVETVGPAPTVVDSSTAKAQAAQRQALEQDRQTFWRERQQWESERDAADARLAEQRQLLDRDTADVRALRTNLEAERQAWRTERDRLQGELDARAREVDRRATELAAATQAAEQGPTLPDATRLDELAEQHQRLDQRQREIDEHHAHLESQRQQVEAQQQEINAQRQQLETQRQQLETQRQQLESQRQQLESGRGQLENDRRQVDDQRRTLNERCRRVEEQSSQLADGQQQLAQQRERHDGDRRAAVEQLAEQQAALGRRSAELESLWQTLEAQRQEWLAQQEQAHSQQQHHADQSRRQTDELEQMRRTWHDEHEESRQRLQRIEDDLRTQSAALDEDRRRFDQQRQAWEAHQATAASPAKSVSDVPDAHATESADTSAMPVRGLLAPDPPTARYDTLAGSARKTANAASPRSGVASQTSHAPHEDDEQSIERYMADLLNRVRGQSSASGEQSPTRTAPFEADPAEPAIETAPADVASAQPEARPAEPPPRPTFAELAAESGARRVQRKAAPAPTTDLAAMREIANLTTRVALTKHGKRRWATTMGSKLVVISVAVATGTIMSIVGAQRQSALLVVAISAWVVAAYWGVQALWLTRRFWKNTRSLSPDRKPASGVSRSAVSSSVTGAPPVAAGADPTLPAITAGASSAPDGITAPELLAAPESLTSPAATHETEPS